MVGEKPSPLCSSTFFISHSLTLLVSTLQLRHEIYFCPPVGLPCHYDVMMDVIIGQLLSASWKWLAHGWVKFTHAVARQQTLPNHVIFGPTKAFLRIMNCPDEWPIKSITAFSVAGTE